MNAEPLNTSIELRIKRVLASLKCLSALIQFVLTGKRAVRKIPRHDVIVPTRNLLQNITIKQEMNKLNDKNI